MRQADYRNSSSRFRDFIHSLDRSPDREIRHDGAVAGCQDTPLRPVDPADASDVTKCNPSEHEGAIYVGERSNPETRGIELRIKDHREWQMCWQNQQ